MKIFENNYSPFITVLTILNLCEEYHYVQPKIFYPHLVKRVGYTELSM